MRSREIGWRSRAIVSLRFEQANLLPVAGLARSNAIGRARSCNCLCNPIVNRALIKLASQVGLLHVDILRTEAEAFMREAVEAGRR